MSVEKLMLFEMRCRAQMRVYEDGPGVTATFKDLLRVYEDIIEAVGLLAQNQKEIGFHTGGINDKGQDDRKKDPAFGGPSDGNSG